MGEWTVETTLGKVRGVAERGVLVCKGMPYAIGRRATMILDVPCRLELDPARAELDAWQGMEVIP